MDFDHLTPDSKQGEVMRLIGRAGMPRILSEVAKCEIVCANCHRMRTYNRHLERLERE
jgi:hypothetical protein